MRTDDWPDMAKKKYSIAARLILALAIPTLYCFITSIVGYSTFTGSETKSSAPIFSQSRFVAQGSSRKLLQFNETLHVETPETCISPSIDEFPPDGLTRDQRQKGYIIIHVIIAIYSFLLLAIVCDDFFVPSITKICEKLAMSQDVAGATFMAAATSSPELFINIIGTFVTEGDLGVGTIVGSAVFNILAVPACCGLFAAHTLDLEWWPVSRDSLAYGLTVILLIFTLNDSRVEWYEAFLLVLCYILYILAMCFNTRISECLKLFVKRRRKYKNVGEGTPLICKPSKLHDSFMDPKECSELFKNAKVKETFYQNGDYTKHIASHDCGVILDIESLENSSEVSEIVSMTSWPNSGWEKCWWVATWPINAALLVTIPDCRRTSLRNWYPFTFLMCIAWIAGVSYIVGWVITIIGDTLMIPDSVMGLTFLAAGMSVPEAVSSVIVTNQGHGTMGISNSIGSNVFDVLLCLGLPWFFKSVFFPAKSGDHFVKINSEGLIYSSVSLMSTLILLYVTLSCNRFKLDRRVGWICLFLYGVFLVFASLIELNVFFVATRPTCEH